MLWYKISFDTAYYLETNISKFYVLYIQKKIIISKIVIFGGLLSKKSMLIQCTSRRNWKALRLIAGYPRAMHNTFANQFEFPSTNHYFKQSNMILWSRIAGKLQVIQCQISTQNLFLVYYQNFYWELRLLPSAFIGTIFSKQNGITSFTDEAIDSRNSWTLFKINY